MYRKCSPRVFLAPILLCLTFGAGFAETVDRVDDAYEITLKHTNKTSGGSSRGSSSSGGALVERVLALRDGGMKVEFDLPKGTPADQKKREWQFPARISMTPAKLTVKTQNSTKFATVELQIDPEVIRKQRVETDAILAELMGRANVDFEAAFRSRQSATISGTVMVNYEVNKDGSVIQRTKKTVVHIKEPAGKIERSETNETVTWKRF